MSTHLEEKGAAAAAAEAPAVERLKETTMNECATAAWERAQEIEDFQLRLVSGGLQPKVSPDQMREAMKFRRLAHLADCADQMGNDLVDHMRRANVRSRFPMV